jgi:hypothetical protein
MGKKPKVNSTGYTCPSCGREKVCRPWWTDRNGVRHYAATYGKRVVCFCPHC